jgi:hypothetical protein
MGPLEIALAVAALLIGATGTFSPCGLSAIDTIGPTGHTGGRRITAAACATFAPGAVIGGLITFGLLALVGDLLHGAGGRVAYGVAAAIALLAAILEARGTRIMPQIRRQLPEHWRRVMPMPLAAALYGVLLGLGFTTFVLSFGVWALAGVSLAIGDPSLGLLLGACFGVGRAIPIVVLAPLSGSPAGIRATEILCERESSYRRLRLGDAAALAAAAVALIVVPASAGASGVSIPSATDPAATADALLFQKLGGPAVINRGGSETALPGAHPTIGGRYIATTGRDAILLLDRNTLAQVASIPAPGANAVAVSDTWLAYRASSSGGDGLFIRSIVDPAAPAPPVQVDGAGGTSQLSPPSLDQGTLVYAVASPGGSRVVERTLGTSKHRVLVRSGQKLLFSPAVSGTSFSYTRTDVFHSRLMVRRVRGGGAGRVLYSIPSSSGTLWSSALTDSTAYVTVLNPSASNAGASIAGISRAHPLRLHDHPPRGGGGNRY